MNTLLFGRPPAVCLFLAIALAAICCPPLGAQNQAAGCTNAGAGAAAPWTPWECVFEVADNGAFLAGRKAYLSRIAVEYSAPGAVSRKGYAAWDGQLADGKHRFVMRHLFERLAEDAPATWTWTTRCETAASCGPGATTPSLAASGQVVVGPAAGEDRLSRQGLLAVRETSWKTVAGAVKKWGRLRQTAGGGLFPWVGDSAWAAPMRASDEEWAAYLADRAGRGITVIQIGPAPAWTGPADAGRRFPFARLDGCETGENIEPTSCDLPEPEFWRAFEKKIELANRHGLYVFLAGMMEPRSEHPSGNGPQNYPSAAEAVNFAHWLGARLSGSFVVFSPGFDSPRIAKEQDLQKAVGRELARVNPRHLVTQHWATVELAEIAGLHQESWLAFEMFQSGHKDGDGQQLARRAREMAAKISGSSSPPEAPFAANAKPAVNGEAVYDNGGVPKAAFSDYRARQAGYLSWLSGAAGYSFGVGGIWDWGLCGRDANHPTNPCRFQMPVGWRNFSEAMAQDSARSMRQMAQLVASFGDLPLDAAEQGRILDQPLEQTKKMVLGRTAGGLLAYLPHNPMIRIRHAGINTATGMWIDPATGVAVPVAETAETAVDNVTCSTPPGDCTWSNRFYQVSRPSRSDRLLRLAALPARRWPSATSRELQVFAGRLAAEAPWGIHGWLLDAGRRPVGEPFPIDAAAGQEGRAPAAAHDGQGNFLVVWQALAAAKGRGLGIFGRRLAASGEPAGAAFPISPPTERDLTTPAVALDAAGDAVVVWRSIRPVDGNGEIWARAVRRDGTSGDPVLVAGGAGVDCSQPKVAMGREGKTTIAWVERSLETGREEVKLRRYETAKLEATPAPQQVNTAAAPELWLVDLHLDAGGKLEVEYEARFGPRGGGTYLQSFAADGARLGAEKLAAPAFAP